MMAARPPPWTPGVVESVKLAKRSLLAYGAFSTIGIVLVVFTILSYDHGERTQWQVPLFFGASLVAVPVGQLVALLRVRFIVFLAVWAIAFGLTIVAAKDSSSDYVAMAMLVEFGLGCGFLSLQHRFELIASFLPTVGWIGTAIEIINNTGRVSAWEREKAGVWTPGTLLVLAGFLVFFLAYLMTKHTQRLMLWQALGGGATRRIARPVVDVVPKRNVGPLVLLAALLFLVTALLAPYLWRTGSGDHSTDKPGAPREGQTWDDAGEELVVSLERFAQQAERVIPAMWPLALLLIAYRPLKRAFVLQQLREPTFPTAPSERIEHLWEYLRIAMVDAGVNTQASDSAEQLVAKLDALGPRPRDLDKAAAIYTRTRYGLAVVPGDAAWLRGYVVDAARDIRSGLSPRQRVAIWWRPLD
jgi:hypothetical protein